MAFNCSEQKEDKVEESSPPPHVEYITLLNSKPDRMKTLIGESFGMAVLDSGCTKSVTGEMWLDEYLQTLSEQDRLQVSERSNDATFRFGNGVEVTSSKLVKFPVVIGSQKAPPVFNEEEDYLNWKNDLEVWKLFTDTEKKMGPAVYLTLTGHAREAVRDLKPADIGKETGLDGIIVKLDAVYLKDENTRAYVAFKEFYEFKRASGENFSEFIVKYEHLYHKLTQYKMIIGSKKFFIEADVVKNELPLLLSRQSMKRAEMIINFSNDAVNVGGKDIIKLTCTTSGHYCLPLTRLLFHDSSSNCKIVLHAVNLRQ